MKFREEKDTLGTVQIPADRLWGAQSQRSLENFDIGQETFTREMIWALAVIKKCAAHVNANLDLLDWEKSETIGEAAVEVMEGRWDDHFPLKVWQTGSGTQTNMNMNEVLSHLAFQKLGGKLGDKNTIHPNDDVNKSQSSNDVFPTAMHIATVEKLSVHLLPALGELKKQIQSKAKEFQSIIKVGRTHLMDAAPLSFGQEFSGYVAQIEKNENRINQALKELYELAIGGTAVGTGLNTVGDFSKDVVKEIAKETGRPFVSSDNKFYEIATHDSLVHVSSTLRTLAVSLMKIANDIRWMGSGPRCGLSELILPANEPGSSIMPGKVNPTQCEALTMVCAQVIGNDSAIQVGGMGGQFELNAFKPLIIRNILHSVDILGSACMSFSKNCIQGIEVNKKQIKEYTEKCLMLATALNPHVGYENAAKIVYSAHNNGSSLKEEAVRLKVCSAEQFDQWIQLEKMISPSQKS